MEIDELFCIFGGFFTLLAARSDPGRHTGRRSDCLGENGCVYNVRLVTTCTMM